MKTCTKCGTLKSLDNFNKRSRSKDGYQQHCKQCHKALNTKHYLANKEVYISRAIAWTSTSKSDLKKIIEDVKSCGCSICGESRPWVLDFHHLNPQEKDLEVSALIGYGSKERLLNEINKCVLLCRNCHADTHYKERIGEGKW